MSTFKSYAKVDFHAHYIPDAYLNGMNECFGGNPDKFPQPTWSEEKHLAFNKEMGIVYSLLSVSSPHVNFGTPEYNRKLARLCNDEGAAVVARHPDAFGLMASLPLPDIESSIAEIAHCCDELQVVGFTLPTNTKGTYISAPELLPIWEELNRRGALVTFHPNKPGAIPQGVASTLPIPMMEFFFDTTRTLVDLILKDYITKYSNVKFLLPHAGALLAYIIDRLESFKPILVKTGTVTPAFDVKAIVAKLYADTAGSSSAKQVPDMRQLLSDDRFFYASDFPFTPDALIEEQGTSLFEANYMTPKLRKKIFYENAETFLGKKLVK